MDAKDIFELMFNGGAQPPAPMGGAMGAMGPGGAIGAGGLLPAAAAQIFGVGQKPPPQQPAQPAPFVAQDEGGNNKYNIQALLEAILGGGKGDRQDVPGKENRMPGPVQGPPGTGVGATEFQPGAGDDYYLGPPRGLGLMNMWGQLTGYGQPKGPGG